MTITDNFVDMEGALRTWLRAQTEISTLVGNRVFFGVPDNPTAFPIITIQRYGGGAQTGDAPLDDGQIQFDCWAGIRDKAQSWAVAKAVIEALFSMGEQDLDAATHGHGASDITWLFFPDPATDRARYVVQATVTAAQK